MTHLCQAAQDSRIQGKYVVVEIVGEMEMRGISDFIEEACAEKSKAVTVEELRLAHPSHKRDASLAGNGITRHISFDGSRTHTNRGLDNIFAQSLEAIAEGNSYTILFLSPGEPRYEPEFEEALHMDVKRQLEDTVLRRRDNATQWQNASLFDKYQFFSPGMFVTATTVKRDERSDRLCRNFHGAHHCNRAIFDRVCRNKGSLQPGSFVRRIQQGNGPVSAEEATVILRPKPFTEKRLRVSHWYLEKFDRGV